MSTINPTNIVHSVEEATPLFFKGYHSLMEKIGVEKPPQLFVAAKAIGDSPASASIPADRIFVHRQLAALGDHPVSMSLVAHEAAHVLTGKGQSFIGRQISLTSLPRVMKENRNIEQEMDRIATMMTGSHEPMIAGRKWIKDVWLEEHRPSNHLQSTTILSRANRDLNRWMEDQTYHGLYGSEQQLVDNIKNVDLSDKSYLERVVAGYNSRKALTTR